MAQRKADCDIGERAWDEAMRISYREHWSFLRLCKELMAGKTTIRMWREGCAPGSLSLLRLREHGADLHYILTGEPLAAHMKFYRTDDGKIEAAVPIKYLVRRKEYENEKPV